jgi:hypothetical protein
MHRALHLTWIFLLLSLLAACSRSTAPTSVPASLPSPSPQPVIKASPTARTPALQPTLTAGQWNALFYHPQLEKVILVNGGPDRGKPAGDPLELWAWDGSDWSLLSAALQGPRWRNFAGTAFDTQRNVLVFHGGLQNAGKRMDEPWEWDGQTWKQFSASGPGFREGEAMVYDEARGEVILYGGANEEFEMMGDTWRWDGSQWTQAAASGPPPRFPSAIVYDAAREKVLLFSGHSVSGDDATNYSDFWEWDGAAWREITPEGEKPTGRNIAQMVFDPASQKVLLFGGGEDNVFLSDMWTWDGATWTQDSGNGAPARSGIGGAYDRARGKLVVFGGVERPGGKAVTDTWEWDGQNWECVWGCK